MTNLISSFLIDPVVRQARRFSRPSASNDSPRPNIGREHSSQDNVATAGQATTIEEEMHDRPAGHGERIEELDLATVSVPGAISDRPLVSSPMSEDGRLETALDVLQRENPSFPPSASRRPQGSVRNTGSMPSVRMSIDQDISHNPAYTTADSFNSTDTLLTASLSNASQAIANATMSPAEGPSRRSTRQSQRASTGPVNRPRGRTLPEDDGMSELRRRIKEIQEMDIPSQVKAKMMHELMTEKYNPQSPGLHPLYGTRQRSPGSPNSQDRPFTPTSTNSAAGFADNSPTTASLSPIHESNNPYNVTASDRIPTYAPIVVHPESDGSDMPDSVAEEPRMLGCQHYKRNVKLQCSTCNRWYPCRFCHDDAEDHTLIRKDTKNMLCMLCGRAQPAGHSCVGCGERAAWYYCDKCKLWDNDSDKAIYHCNDCGLCRIGRGLGKDYYHCKTCSVCVSMSIANSHRCIERSTDCDCPICGEYMFTSTLTVVFMSCGHSIHHKCYYDHMKTSYKCPICSRSIVNMETQFRNLDRTIESQPMPPQFQDTKALVSCNDCSAKSSTKYHWLGLKCAVCHSYNTVQLQIMSGPDADRNNLQAANASGPNNSNFLQPPSPSRGALSEPVLTEQPSSQPSEVGRLSSPVPDSPIPNRARSVSPPCRPSLGIEMTTDTEDDEDVDFWGGSSPRDYDMEAEDDVDDEELSEDEDMDEDMEDDADDVHDIDIFGHR